MSLLLIGTYIDFNILAHKPKGEMGKGVSVYDFNNGEIKFIQLIPEINPAIIIPYNKYIYAIQETINRKGKINIYKNENNNFNLMSTVETGGKSSCYLDIKDQYLVNINYWDGIIDLFLIESNGESLKLLDSKNNNHRKNYRQVINIQDHLNNRQVGSYTHFCSARFILQTWTNKNKFYFLAKNKFCLSFAFRVNSGNNGCLFLI